MSARLKKTLYRIVLAAAVFALVYIFAPDDNAILRFALFMLPYLLIGYDVLYSAVRNAFSGRVFDEQLLMSIATLGAIALKEYPEAVAIMLFYQIGEWFQAVAVGRSRKSIAKLTDIRPDSATVISNGAETVVSPDEVNVGDIIRVRPGERIPLDGEILSGATDVNLSALTGESLPVARKAGERVLSGSVNITGVIDVTVESVYAQSTVSRILELVENASEKKARSEKFITRFSRVYTPCVVLAAALLATIPYFAFGLSFAQSVERALIFLMVSCPCALVVSVPLSFFGGIGGASREGVLIKGSNHLETLSKVKSVAFDKTGTLTQGVFAVKRVNAVNVSDARLIELAAHAEANSSHPIAKSIVSAYGHQIDPSRIGKVTELGGSGVVAEIDGREIRAGNAALMAAAGAKITESEDSGTTVYIADGSVYLGSISAADEIKPTAKSAISELRDMGIEHIYMLTGDRRNVADSVGKSLGTDGVFSELLPADKVKIVEKLLETDSPLAFAGDGINDSPVLMRADVGIAMGALGSDAAIEAADVVLTDDNPAKIALAIKTAKRTMSIVKQNIAFILAIKAVVLALGALGMANMWLAVFVDVGVMMLATLNATRALKARA